MSTGTLLAIILPVVAVVAVLAALGWYTVRRRRLQARFGPEYERTVEDTGSRGAADRELSAREKRHDALDIKPLSSGVRDRYAQDWQKVQGDFVDHPEEAVHEADLLVASLMRERGYPTDNLAQKLQDLSVEHGRTVEHYRAAHDVNERSLQHRANTEQLRGAMVHYRALFDELLSDGGPRQAHT
ncbi:hypothetical protein ACH46N_32225 [Streptomyces pristinaespiralis]|jgi:hypothetical protein|uniref:Secreted protein n=2 Tax=Streptomyces pristinaespiralis TaxID=38300 RepID=B5HFK8_STRE2|nr:hypothetical protein [Streptomyces pristinaespiralis]ALC20546.1 secreted protein [Streptomyces pristinaespiralis]EDY65619.2 secreted protein [Streptomyces pristinaespiralis ATCC 25486]QMU16608.1 hypothetical protein H3L99_25815 [Streptomyces pristinaespiralis]